MACLRETPVDGRVGVIPCDEEGCLFRRVTNPSGTITADDPSEADCLLQLRLRAGDTEDIVVPPGDNNRLDETEPRIIYAGTMRNLSLDDQPNAFGYGLDHAKLYIEFSGEEREFDTREYEGKWSAANSGSMGQHAQLDPDEYYFRKHGELIVSHDNGKTEHNRAREQWERFMGLSAESGRPEGEHPAVHWERIDAVRVDLGVDGIRVVHPAHVEVIIKPSEQHRGSVSGGDLPSESEPKYKPGGDPRNWGNAPDESRLTPEDVRGIVVAELFKRGLIAGSDGNFHPPTQSGE